MLVIICNLQYNVLLLLTPQVLAYRDLRWRRTFISKYLDVKRVTDFRKGDKTGQRLDGLDLCNRKWGLEFKKIFFYFHDHLHEPYIGSL